MVKGFLKGGPDTLNCSYDVERDWESVWSPARSQWHVVYRQDTHQGCVGFTGQVNNSIAVLVCSPSLREPLFRLRSAGLPVQVITNTSKESKRLLFSRLQEIGK